MPFSPAVKREVKEKAAFRCCRCHQIGVDVHHVRPRKDGGGDNLDNAAPLCQNCHSQFGDNPSKRRELVEMRDWWYRTCERTYAPDPGSLEVAGKLDSILEGVQRHDSNMEQLKSVLKQMADGIINEITPASARLTASRMASMATHTGITQFESIDIRPGHTAIVCKGDFEMSTAGMFDSVVDVATLNPDTVRIIVDLIDTDYIDSRAIGSLLRARRLMSQQGGALELIIKKGRLLNTMEVTGLIKIFRVYESRRKAGIG